MRRSQRVSTDTKRARSRYASLFDWTAETVGGCSSDVVGFNLGRRAELPALRAPGAWSGYRGERTELLALLACQMRELEMPSPTTSLRTRSGASWIRSSAPSEAWPIAPWPVLWRRCRRIGTLSNKAISKLVGLATGPQQRKRHGRRGACLVSVDEYKDDSHIEFTKEIPDAAAG
jgi:hypothetical protein